MYRNVQLNLSLFAKRKKTCLQFPSLLLQFTSIPVQNISPDACKVQHVLGDSFLRLH